MQDQNILYLLRSLYILFILLSTPIFAQHFVVNGRVIDQDNRGVAYANILVLRAADSTGLTGTTTEEDGRFYLPKLEAGKYILNISYLGYEALLQPLDIRSNLDVGDLKITESTENLDEVNIIVKRPTLTKLPDRLTFNVASTALIEGSILQLLKSTPSLIVIDGDIKIKNSNADVYINNRKIQLSSAELMELLESAPANSIQSIEVITNPPASYDASSGSVINIVMSKNLIAGYRGSVSGKYTQGVFPQYNASTSHFFKGEKSNLGLTYSFTKEKINRDNEDIVFYLDSANEVDEIWSSDINRNTYSDRHSLGINYDTYFDARNTLILTSSMLFVPYFKYKIKNETDIIDDSGQFLSSFIANNLSRDETNTLTFDLDYIHKLKKKGKLSFNTNFTLYDYNRYQVVNSDFYDQDELYQSSSRFNTDNNQDTRIYSSKLDYSLPIDESANFDTGIKFSFITTESDITRTDVIDGSEIVNLGNTDAFDYDEKIAAGYFNYSKEWEKFSLNIGLRVENTELIGLTVSDGNTNQQEYIEWFPNGSFLYKISDNFNIYTNYKRSIQRPSYTSLNPFTFFLNENLVVVGNPALQPILTDHGLIGTTLFDIITVEAYYKQHKNAINEIPRQDNDTNIISYTPVNLDKSIDYGFDFVSQFPIGERFYLYAVTSFFNLQQETSFEEDFVKIDRWSNFSNINVNLNLLEDNSLSINLNVVYLSKYITSLSVVDDNVFSIISISKSLFKNKGTLSLWAGDLFNMEDRKTTTRYLNQFSIYDTDLDNRYVSLGFRYKFGNTKLQLNEREIKTEETDRIKKEQEQD